MNQLMKDARTKVHTAPKKMVRMHRVDPEHLDAQKKLKESVAAVKKTLHTLKMERKLRERKHKRVMKKCNILSNSELLEIMIMKRNVAKEKTQRAQTLEMLGDADDGTGDPVTQPDDAGAGPSTSSPEHPGGSGGDAVAGAATDSEPEQAEAPVHATE